MQNVISATANGFGKCFYQPKNFTVLQDSYAIKLINYKYINEIYGLFFITSLNKIYSKYNWANKSGWEKVKKEYIKLPTKNGEIDFDFMESFISELEAYHISELEAYLLATGLKDYKLTEDEEKALEDFNNLKWKEFRLDNIFKLNSSKKRFDANKVNILKVGNYPYIVRTSSNNGQKGFINEDKLFLNKGNTISFGQDTATMFYQEKPYFTGDKIKILEPKFTKFDKKNSQFFISSMRKSFCQFSWGSSRFNEDTIKNQYISLPIKNNEIDFEFIEVFISAIQKLIIKDVVLYADRKILETKKLVVN